MEASISKHVRSRVTASWGAYDRLSVAYDVAERVLCGMLDNIDGTPKQRSYLDGLLRQYVKARASMVRIVGNDLPENDIIKLARIGLAWCAAHMPSPTRISVIIDALVGGPTGRPPTHASPCGAYGIAASIITATDHLDHGVLGAAESEYIARVQAVLPLLPRAHYDDRGHASAAWYQP